MVARQNLADSLSDALDDSGSLVPQYCGQRIRNVLVQHRQVSVAHSGGHDSDKDLVAQRIRKVD
jgi:hypothetical protein